MLSIAVLLSIHPVALPDEEPTLGQVVVLEGQLSATDLGVLREVSEAVRSATAAALTNSTTYAFVDERSRAAVEKCQDIASVMDRAQCLGASHALVVKAYQDQGCAIYADGMTRFRCTSQTALGLHLEQLDSGVRWFLRVQLYLVAENHLLDTKTIHTGSWDALQRRVPKLVGEVLQLLPGMGYLDAGAEEGNRWLVKSIPAGATVLVDDLPHEQPTPTWVTLAPNTRYVLTAQLTGYSPTQRVLQLTAAPTFARSIVLDLGEPLPPQVATSTLPVAQKSEPLWAIAGLVVVAISWVMLVVNFLSYTVPWRFMAWWVPSGQRLPMLASYLRTFFTRLGGAVLAGAMAGAIGVGLQIVTAKVLQGPLALGWFSSLDMIIAGAGVGLFMLETFTTRHLDKKLEIGSDLHREETEQLIAQIRKMMVKHSANAALAERMLHATRIEICDETFPPLSRQQAGYLLYGGGIYVPRLVIARQSLQDMQTAAFYGLGQICLYAHRLSLLPVHLASAGGRLRLQLGARQPIGLAYGDYLDDVIAHHLGAGPLLSAQLGQSENEVRAAYAPVSHRRNLLQQLEIWRVDHLDDELAALIRRFTVLGLSMGFALFCILAGWGYVKAVRYQRGPGKGLLEKMLAADLPIVTEEAKK